MNLRATTIGALLLSCWASAAFAQSEDAVLVLSVGGVESVTAFDVVRDPEPRSTNLGTRRVLPAEIGPATIADIRVLPDGGFLLADAGGRGVVVTTSEGDAFRYVLDPMLRYPAADAASVASYFSPGEPSLILLGDSGNSSVSVRSVSTGDLSWFRSMRLATSTATIVQAIVMPGNRVAVAVFWPEANVSAVEVHDLSEPDDLGVIRFISADHPEAGANDTIVPEIEQVRDLVGLPNGNLLVTSQSNVIELALDGTVERSWSTGDFAVVNGELASARPLPSGNIALVTFERGEWVRPHSNHRVHWLDPETSQIVATSEVLTRAPSRVEPLAGSGGTGTLGFDAGLEDLEQGDASDIELEELLIRPDPVRVGESLRARVSVTNTGAFPVALASLTVHGSVGTCDGELQSDHVFANAESVAIGAGQTYSFGNEEPIDAQFGRGAWCAYVEGRDRQGISRRYGAGVEFEIQERLQGSGSSVEVTPLPFGDEIPEPDVGVDAGADVGPSEEWVAKQGCCGSVSATGGGNGSRALLAALFLLAAVRLGRR